MDKSVKRMLKLIEEDGDSFAKKAEMYYQKRPELIALVEEFYRMYRSLAERYDHVTGELKKNIPSDLQSQGSGISEIVSELPSASPSPDQRITRHKSGPRAAGFDVFLGSGGSSSDVNQKEGDESSSLTDSESESDASSVNNYSILMGNGGDQALNKKIIELEIELREAKEKLLQMQQEEGEDGSLRRVKSESFVDLHVKIAAYEQELKTANEKIQVSEEEIARLKYELQKYKSSETTNGIHAHTESSEVNDVQQTICSLEGETQDEEGKIQALVEELRIAKESLQDSEKEIARLKQELESNKSSDKIRNLQDQLESAQKDVVMGKNKLNVEKREASKLQERITRLKTSLSDRDHEIRDLNIAVSDAEQKIFPEKAQIKAEISKLLEERTHLEQQLREWESRGRSLEDEIRKITINKTEMEERLTGEIKLLEIDILERSNHIENLNESLVALKSERDSLNKEIVSLKSEMSSRDNRIDEMDQHLHQLHMEHVQLIAGGEVARKLIEELRSRVKELEEEIKRQSVLISEAAEEKREAIRQLCFSLEHYRNGYNRLRQAVIGHKGVPILAS